MLVSGYDPVAGYTALWNGVFGEVYYVGETVRQITPYILAGFAVLLPLEQVYLISELKDN